jgi:membrane associated rhomboid family serine protease
LFGGGFCGNDFGMKRFMPALVLTLLCWLVFALNNVALHGELSRFGIIPRRLASLPGILWAPFLHGSLAHLAANTMPLLILAGILCARSKGEFMGVTLAGIFIGGGLTWLFARPACHIGASGLIFAYFGYLASLAWFKRTFGTLLVSVACLFLYGGILTGLIPTSNAISWEAHVAGLVAGVGFAALYSKLEGIPPAGANPPPVPGQT